jgi:hypothetical protein
VALSLHPHKGKIVQAANLVGGPTHDPVEPLIKVHDGTSGQAHTLSGNRSGPVALREQREQLESKHHKNETRAGETKHWRRNHRPREEMVVRL